MNDTKLRKTRYAEELRKPAKIDFKTHGSEGRIEYLRFKKGEAKGKEGYRFSWWKGNRMAPRPADFTESELLDLFGKAIREKVFSDYFTKQLARIAVCHLTEDRTKSS